MEIDGTAIGLELAVPILSGGAVVSQTREATERHQQAIEQREQARRESYRRTRVAFLGVVAGISRIKALKQAVQSSEVSVSSTQAGLEVGHAYGRGCRRYRAGVVGARRDYARRATTPVGHAAPEVCRRRTLTSGDLAAVNGFLER